MYRYPSGTDEETFQHVFGNCDWAVMYILARGGQTCCRLRFNTGPGGQMELPIEVDYSERFDPDARTATLVLPAPKVIYARLNQERTKIYSINRQGLWWLAWGDGAAHKLINKAMREAQSMVDRVTHDHHVVRQAQDHSERILTSVLKSLGWRLTLVWLG